MMRRRRRREDFKTMASISFVVTVSHWTERCLILETLGERMGAGLNYRNFRGAAPLFVDIAESVWLLYISNLSPAVLIASIPRTSQLPLW